MTKALIIEDDDRMAELLIPEISGMGFEVVRESDGASGLSNALTGDYSLVILDMTLPKLDGVEVCRKIREQISAVPIIMLTAKHDETHKVLLLQLGADDYITKPFSMAELKARVTAVVRRSNRTEVVVSEDAPSSLAIGGLQIDLKTRRVFRDGQLIELTAKEYDTLSLLMENPGRPFNRDELNEYLYGAQISLSENNITSHINRLRIKLEENPNQPRYLLTKRGFGYYFNDQLE